VIPIVIVAGATLLASFLCSLFEAALYAITPSKIGVLRERGLRSAAALEKLRREVEEPIAAILTLNTIAHTVGAAWCGAMVGAAFGSQAVGVFAAVFTVLVLAVTEIVPKSVGVRYAMVIGPAMVLPLRLMIFSVWPIVWLTKRVMSRLVGREHPAGPTEDEVVVAARLAGQQGEVRPEEQRWVRNALRLDQVTAGDLRTPRTVTESLPADTRVAELVEHVDRWVHSRVPVTDGEHPDRVIGLVHRREVIDRALLQPEADLTLRDVLRPIRFVPESMPAHELLELFITERFHMVAVVDEYGGFEGVTTLEDVLECLLGAEIVDEHDQVADMQVLARQRNRRRPARRRDGDEAAEGSARPGVPPPGTGEDGDGAGEDGEGGADDSADPGGA